MAQHALRVAVQSLCKDLPEAASIRGALTACFNQGHEFYSDGSHLSEEGISAIADAVQSMATSVCADVVVSDSCLCAVRPDFEDRQGKVLDGLIDVPVRPRWGASFMRGSFKWCIYNAWKEFPDATMTLVLTAGNDIWHNYNPQELKDPMIDLQEYWRTGDVSVVYVDVIP